MFGDIKSPKVLHFKGWLFLVLGILSGFLIILKARSYTISILLAICIWACCRFYYYAFYVIEKYIDSEYKHTGIISFLLYFFQLSNSKDKSTDR